MPRLRLFPGLLLCTNNTHLTVERQGSVDSPVVAILFKARYQLWLFCMFAGGSLEHSCAQSWFLCRRLLLVYLQGNRHHRSSFSSLGSDEPVRAALIRVLGGGQPRLRDFPHHFQQMWISKSEYDEFDPSVQCRFCMCNSFSVFSLVIDPVSKVHTFCLLLFSCVDLDLPRLIVNIHAMCQ